MCSFVLLTECYYSDEVKEDHMSGARGRCGAKEKRILGSGEGKRLHGRPRRRG